MKRKPIAFALLVVCVLVSAAADGQVVNSLGVPAFSSIGGGAFDQINLGNLNSHFDIPIIYKAGRGLPFTFSLSYDSLVWAPVASGSTNVWSATSNYGWHPTGTYTLATFASDNPQTRSCTYLRQQYTYTYFRVRSVTDPMSVVHYINRELSNDTDVPCNPDKSFLQVPLSDGSGMTANISTDGVSVSGSLLLLNGTQIGGGNGTWQDNNGNYISGAVDTLGYTAMVVGGQTPPTPVTYKYTSPTDSYPAATATYTVKYDSTKTIQTAFGCAPTVNDVQITHVNLVSEIDLPDYGSNSASKYLFTYEQTPGWGTSYTTGRLHSVTLPTGGSITYTYGSVNCADGTPLSITRQTSDGGTTTYARSNSSGPWITTIQNPLNEFTTITFAIYTTSPGPSLTNFYETKRVVQDNSTPPNTYATLTTCYNQTCPNGATTTFPITSVGVYSQFGSSGRAKSTYTSYNTNGLPTLITESDYSSLPSSTVPPATGGTLRSTVINYSGAYPIEVDINNSAGTTIGKALYIYDETGSITATSGTPNHLSGVNSGNVTTIKKWVSGTNYLIAHYKYFDTGNIKEYDDPNSSSATYSYGNCGNSFLSSATPPISALVTTSVWNCMGGVQTSSTDPNGAQESVAYADPYYWRPTSTTDALGNVTGITYPDSNTVQSALNFNGSSSTSTSRMKVDAFGRSYLFERKQGQGSSWWDIVETFYDKLGRPNYQTLPYSGTVDTTTTTSTPGVSTQFDALSRPTSVTDSAGGSTSYAYSDNDTLVVASSPATKRQMESNGIGQLTSVCELTSSANGGGNCAQSSAVTGFWTTYTYDVLGDLNTVTLNAQAASGLQQSRSFSFDGLGRLLSETNPETGTTNYTYDTESGCGSTSTGDLIKRTDPQGDAICTFYDSIHRPTKTTFSGWYASSTPTRNFVYDGASVNNVSMSNSKGRLAEAFTGTSSNKITDLLFSYTARGEVANAYESTPHSGGYYQLNANYWANGALSAFSGIPGVPVVYYQVDGEGRTSTVTTSDSNNPTLVSNCCGFTPGSLPTTITFGSGDSDNYSFDSNTNRLTQYQLSVGSNSVKGVLNWNTNGTMSSHAITDTINSANTHTCTYTYDDISRLSKADCSPTWGQTFAYDPFGNISKAVISGANGQSFQASYYDGIHPITNRITSLTGFAPSYDNNGNLTNDSFHQYSWDAVGNMVGADSVTVTYDALDRAVEQGRGSSYTQIVYSPDGAKVALMNGSALSTGLVTLPAGAQAIYNSSGLSRYRHADYLGSARVASNAAGGTYGDLSYAPFSEPYNQYGTADLAFTGQNQDTVSGIYDYLYRELNTAQGRWVSPDRAGLASVNTSNPQSWNRYSYVSDNPTNLLDPLGLYCSAPYGLGDSACNQGNYGGGGGTGGFYNNSPFGLLDLAFRPSWGLVILKDDPSFVNTGEGTLILFGGMWNVADFLNANFPSDWAHLVGPNLRSRKTCSDALKKVDGKVNALDRVIAMGEMIKTAASQAGVDPGIMSAIALRETGAQNEFGDNGNGRGIFQIDARFHPEVSTAQAFNPPFAAQWASNLLASGTARFSFYGPGWSTEFGLHTYNGGHIGLPAVPRLPAFDQTTAGHNYISHVLALASCFQ